MQSDSQNQSFNTDEDLNKVLLRFHEEYLSITNAELKPGATFTTIQADIKTTLEKSRSETKHARTTLFGNVRTCLEKFGEVASNGAAIVFPPSTQCWNAISIIIKAIEMRRDMLDGFVTLMERSSVFLDRLNSFLETQASRDSEILPAKIRKSAYNILFNFLGTLKAAHKLATGGKRDACKVYLKIVLFNDDSGVAERLKLMEEGVKDFLHVEIDEILRDVKGLARYLTEQYEDIVKRREEILAHIQEVNKVTAEIASNVQQIKGAFNGLTSRQEHTEYLAKIRSSLGLGNNEEPWTKRHGEVIRAPETGKWLQDNAMYNQWSDIENRTTKVLILQDEPGSGKTHIISYVVENLTARYIKLENQKHVNLAFYYFSDEKDETLERCIGSIIFQFANKDRAYAKAVAAKCERQTNLMKAKERWNDLVAGLRDDMKGSYFICIDGYDARTRTDTTDAVSAIIEHASNIPAEESVSIRLMFSGNEVVPSDRINNQSIGQIKMDNSRDLQIVIETRIQEIIKSKPELEMSLCESNIQELVSEIKSYKHMNAKIAHISTCKSDQEVQTAIATTGSDWEELLEKEVRALHSSLDPTEAKHLNEIFTWIIGSYNAFGREYVALKVLQGVLWLKFKQKFFLKTSITRIYSRLLMIDEDEDVKFKSDDYYSILSVEERNKKRKQTKGPSNASSREITQPEIDMCKRIVQNACGKHDFNRFNFEKFFQTLKEKPKTDFYVDATSAQASMLTSCLNALHEEEVVLKDLQEYASIWFYEHLKILVVNRDPTLMDRDGMDKVGVQLVNLFYDYELIERWVTEDNLYSLKADLLLTDEYIDPLLSFLETSYAAKDFLNNKEKDEWIRSIVFQNSCKYQLLERTAKQMAKRWFSSRMKNNEDYLWFSWRAYIKITNGKFDENDSHPPLETLDAFLEWAKPEDSDAVWIFCKGRTYATFRYDREAIVAFKEAEEFLSDNWWFLYETLCAYRKLKDYGSSLKYANILKSLHNRFQTDENFRGIYRTEVLIPGVHDRMEIGEFEPAASQCRELLQETGDIEPLPRQSHEITLERFFRCLNKLRKPEEIIAHVNAWQQATDAKLGLKYWLEMTAFNTKVRNIIVAAARDTDRIDSILDLYTHAQNLEPTPTAQIALRYVEGALQIYGSEDESLVCRGIETWEKVIKELHGGFLYGGLLMQTISALAAVFLSKAIESTHEKEISSTNKNYEKRLRDLCGKHSGLGRNFEYPRLCLIRLYISRDMTDSAHIEAQEILCKIFYDWPDDILHHSLRWRFTGLANVFTVLGDDDNAIAAWQATKPAETFTESSPSEMIPKAYIANFFCDGCKQDWKDLLDNCWVCRECYDVQFCDKCYRELQEDECPPCLCNKAHGMLHLPRFQVDLWHGIPDDQMIVNGQHVSRNDWISQIRSKYNVPQEEVDLRMIQKAKQLKAAASLGDRWIEKKKRLSSLPLR